ncbi:MAG: PAS domain-containing sensor histidine kinase [Alphaproteobacteria bacterium]|nr:PAS domain-containing sensor histidine kinase [Alphaproteobacteria bacterium]
MLTSYTDDRAHPAAAARPATAAPAPGVSALAVLAVAVLVGAGGPTLGAATLLPLAAALAGAGAALAWAQHRARATLTALRSLQRSNQRYALAIDGAVGGIWDWDITTGVIEVNARFRELLAATEDPVTPESLARRVHPDDDARVRTGLQAHFDLRRPYEVRHRMRAAGGAWHWFVVRGQTARDGEGRPIRMAGSLIDITERVRADERFRVLYENAPLGMMLSDGGGRISQANGAFLRLVGMSHEELAGRAATDLLAPPEPGDDQEIAAAGDDGAQQFGPYESSLVTADGRRIPVLLSGTHTQNDAGEVRQWTIVQDISALKTAEAHLREAKEEAEGANRAKSEFLAMMSHEIRTPMNGVLGMTGLLLETQLSETQRRMVGAARDSAEVLLTVVNEILDFSKLEAGRVDLENVDFDLDHAVEGVISLLQSKAEAKGIGLAVEYAADTPTWLNGDSGRLKQILFNLIGNAVKFTHAGTISIRFHSDAGDLSGVRLTGRVVDTGIGIPAEVVPQLFARFTQADSSTSRRFGGTGLGLAISRQLAELMGGRVGCESRLGEGSTFWFEVPFARGFGPRQVPGSAAGAAALPKLRPLRILAAEDNPINQMLVTTMLVGFGHHVDVAANGLEAVEAMRLAPYDVVLMDVHMPEMDGIAATRAIRRLPGAAGRTPVIAVTANAMVGDRERYLLAGMNDYVSKPIQIRALLTAIAHATDTIAVDHAAAGADPARAGLPTSDPEAEAALGDLLEALGEGEGAGAGRAGARAERRTS